MSAIKNHLDQPMSPLAVTRLSAVLLFPLAWKAIRGSKLVATASRELGSPKSRRQREAGDAFVDSVLQQKQDSL